MNKNYEKKRENIFKLFRSEEDGVKIKGKHLSFFKESGRVPITGKIACIPENKYEYLLTTQEVADKLKYKIRYNARHWKQWQKDLAADIQHYVNQAESEGCKKVILCYSEYRLLFM